jgi:hypothetical protein
VGAQLRVVQAQVPGPQAEQATLVRLVGRPDDARWLTGQIIRASGGLA